jgi:site-specific DNA recombinase
MKVKEIMMKKVIGYTRVSTLKQVENGYSIKSQKIQIEDYCKRNDLVLVGVLTDGGVSGGSNKGSQNYIKIMDMVRSGEINGVVVYTISRFGRSLIDSVNSVDEMRNHDVVLYTIKEGIRTDTKEGLLQFNLFSSLVEYERETIKQNIKDVLQMKKARGEKFCRGIFGLKVVDGIYVKDETEMLVRRRIRLLHNKGYSLRAICKVLNDDGVKTKLGRDWRANSIKNVLETDITQYIKAA